MLFAYPRTMPLQPALRSRLRRTGAGFLLTALAVLAHAEPVQRAVTITITRIHPMAVQRTHCPTCSGITRINVTPEAWGSTDCRADVGDLFLEDTHILATLLFAKGSGLPMTLEVNNAVRPIDTVCKTTAAFIG